MVVLVTDTPACQLTDKERKATGPPQSAQVQRSFAARRPSITAPPSARPTTNGIAKAIR
jgi:hypothetical protein